VDGDASIRHNALNFVAPPTGTKQSNETTLLVPPVDHNGGGVMIHVLILISSVARKQETVCTTIRYALENFQGDDPSVLSPHILVHRYGDFPCNNSTDNNNMLMWNDKTSLILEQYPPHAHPNNQQQIIDYLNLMEHGIQLIAAQRQTQTQSQPLFSHVMFLDDDVELCPGFGDILVKAARMAFPSSSSSSFGMGHFGRGGSGMYVPVDTLPKLKTKMMQDRERFRSDPRNVDASMMEWGLQRADNTCVLRPVTIQMRHIGFTSSMNIIKEWKDSDRCGAPADNVNWRALSESASTDFFGEHCLNPACSPFTSIHLDDCSTTTSCKEGYTGQDCGLRASDEAWFTRRKYVAPIVALLEDGSEDSVLLDSKRHNLINLYVLGNKQESAWLTHNIYISTNNASMAFQEDLKDTPRWGRLAFPRELITIHSLAPPEDLWSMKYYERRAQKPKAAHGAKYVRRHKPANT
jgi:hypothetical protein